MDSENKSKAFRPTPARVKNSIKILAGTKTNATIRDIEEDEEKELEEMTGTVIEIDRNKINGDGWKVQGDDGNIYQCSCASSMYEIPDSVTRGGVLYPSSTTTVKFTISKVLRRNTITEFLSGSGIDESVAQGNKSTPTGTQNKVIQGSSSGNDGNSKSDGNSDDDEGEEESKSAGTLSVADWQHGDKATTVIAKPMAAISISDGLISFNYNNTNAVMADATSTKIIGEATEINTNNLEVNSSNVTVNGQTIEEKMAEKTQSVISDQAKVDSYPTDQATTTSLNYSDGINQMFIDKERNTVQVIVDSTNMALTNEERVILDIKDQKFFPLRDQSYTITALPFGNDLITAHADGVITIKTLDKLEDNKDIKKTFSSTHVWLAPQYSLKNVITIYSPSSCGCCKTKGKQMSVFFNYCPICQEWYTLQNYANHAKCLKCKNVFCGSCGKGLDFKCSNTLAKLYSYEQNKISTQTFVCNHCQSSNSNDETKVYANYCPSCKKWNYLIQKNKPQNNDQMEYFYCGYCGKEFCSSCGMNLSNEVVKSFEDDTYYYDNYIAKYKKMYFVCTQ